MIIKKLKIIHYWRLVLISLLLTLLTVGAILFLIAKIRKSNTPPPTSTVKLLKNPSVKEYPMYLKIKKRQWTSDLKKNQKAAYETFKKETVNLPFDFQHALSHEFGTMLFALKGANGIGVCDSTFSFGCYHGYVGEAVRAKGFNYIYEMDSSCSSTSSPGACQHGLGHAILVYSGENERVNDALAVCLRLTNYGLYSGCISGVFMEFNYFILRTPPGEPRPLTKENWNIPCVSAPSKLQESCYFFQSQWWAQASSGTQPNYARSGKLCASLSENRLRKSCFFGIGNLSGYLEKYQIKKSIIDCSQMSTSQGELYCRMGLRNLFLTYPEHERKADDACDGLDIEQTKLCKKSQYL